MKRYSIDYGPIYAETIPDRFPVEPWNTFSNLIFLAIVIYLLRTTRLDYRRYPYTVAAIPMLFIGFVGGTVFHATRSHWIWLAMDFVPIFVLAILGCYYFWRGVLGSLWWSGTALVASIVATRLLRRWMEVLGFGFISVGYILLAASILLPAYLHARKGGFRGVVLLIGATVSFAVAIAFRMFDRELQGMFLPMGTHFLWHIFGGVSVFFLLSYIMRSEGDAFSVEEQSEV